jgi:two-component system, NarL family, nitrate/nitrite response regulator NarL
MVAASDCSVGLRMSKKRQMRLLLADDHPIVLRGLASLLGADPRFAVRAVCSSGAEALAELRKGGIDIAILDIGMPGLSGLDVARAVADAGLKTHVILLTAAASDRQREEARNLGASLLFKDAAADELLDLVVGKIDRTGDDPSPLRSAAAPFELTQRELKIAELVATGISNKEIARQLSVSEATVKAHLHNVFTKTGLTSRTALAAFTLRKQTGGS